MLLLIGGILAYVYLPFPWWLVVTGVLAAKEGFELWLWLSLRRRRPASGTEALVGERGELTGSGRVRIQGTSYPAQVLEGDPGDRVVVERVEGMTLVVRRARMT
jgi:membrane protein implicated in regulation of membrane protease activity